MSPPREPLGPRTLAALLVVLAFIAAPHALRLPLWLSVGVGAVGLWRWRLTATGRGLPPRWLRVVLTGLAGAGVAMAYGSWVGLEAGVALLVAMGSLKLLELRRPRDTLVLLYLGYFLIVAQFIHTQAIPAAGYLLIGTWGLTTLLIAVGRDTGGDTPWAHGRLAVRMLGQALPIMILLFIFFPRVGSPLWGMPEEGAAVTGLADRLEPGSISRLSRSGAVAFRVTFSGSPPPRGRRYWRGPVFTRYKRGRWEAGERRGGGPPPRDSRGRAVRHEVMLEPHSRHWLFGLDLPAAAPSGGRLGPDLALLAKEPVRQVRRYRVVSYPLFRVQPDTPPGKRYLALPGGAHPRARRLGAGWRQAAANPAEVVELGLTHFRRGGFSYTLTPPALPGSWMDRFLFETRAGFCGHFAASFAFLMRAAGVPARVVTGYLGGEAAPGEDYFIVRQSDAHAWVEVWLHGRGWVRVDPTTAVSPARAERGLGEAVPGGDPVPLMARSDGGWLKAVRLRLDAMEVAWNRWVLAYGPELQTRFLGRFGLGRWPRMVAAMAAGLALTGGLVALAVLRGRRSQRDPAARAYARLERKLARAGLPRRPAEGPRDFGERAAAAFPRKAAALRAIHADYIRLRYTEGAGGEALARLRRSVARLRLPRRKVPL